MKYSRATKIETSDSDFTNASFKLEKAVDELIKDGEEIIGVTSYIAGWSTLTTLTFIILSTYEAD